MGKSSCRSRSASHGRGSGRDRGGGGSGRDRRMERERDRSRSNRRGSKDKERRHHHVRSRSRDRGEKDSERATDRGGRGGAERRSRSRDKQRRSWERDDASRTWDRDKRRRDRVDRTNGCHGKWKFDSPPREGEQVNSNFSNFSNYLPSGDMSSASAPSGTYTSQMGMLPESNNSSLANIAAAMGLDANATKAARELYIGNLPAGVDVTQLIEFINAAMIAMKANIMPGNAATKAWISTDGHFAFVEFRTMEEASNGMQLNNLNCLGFSLRIGRPKTYPAELAALAPPPTVAALDSSYLARGIAGVHSGVLAQMNSQTPAVATDPAAALAAAQLAASAVAAGQTTAAYQNALKKPDRLCIMDLPANLSEQKVKELVTTFGPVKYFQLLKKDDSSSSGVCICDFEDYDSQVQAVEILEQNTPYQVLKAEEAVSKGLLSEYLKKQFESGSAIMKPQVPTRCLMMCNLVTREELLDDNEYDEIKEDVTLECKTYGTVVSVEIPRPNRFDNPEEDEGGTGYVFVEYADREGSGKARKMLSGRRFAGRVVECHYFSEIKFREKAFDNPSPNYDNVKPSPSNTSLAPSTEESDVKKDEDEMMESEEAEGGGDRMPNENDENACASVSAG